VATPTQIRQRLNSEVERIRGYEDLTEEAKHRRIAEAREKAQAEYQAAVEAEERQVQERAEKPRGRSSNLPTLMALARWRWHSCALWGAAPMTPSTTELRPASSPVARMVFAMPTKSSRGS
jgi:hypothetical protein